MKLVLKISLLVVLLGVVALVMLSRPPTPSQTARSSEQTLPTVKIEELKVGTGATAAPGALVSIHYTGFLGPATFDTSRNRQPLTFRLGKGEVLRGWDEGLLGMKAGGRRRLTVPPELGYGNKASLAGAIPPHSTLVFEIDLLDVQPGSS